MLLFTGFAIVGNEVQSTADVSSLIGSGIIGLLVILFILGYFIRKSRKKTKGGEFSKFKNEVDVDDDKNKIDDKKKKEIALAAAFISYINESIQSVQNGSYDINKVNFNRDVTIKTYGCQLRDNDLDLMKIAVKIALNKALDIISNSNAAEKKQILSELWSGTNNVVVSFSLTPEKKYEWGFEVT